MESNKEEKIAMTSPVAMSLEDSMTMMFMVPKKLNKDMLPRPNQSGIEFKEEPAKTVAAINFNGWANDKKIEKFKEKLKSALDEAKDAKLEAEKLRDAAVEDLDTLQKRTQFELIGLIVKCALYVIIGVGLITTGLYVFAMTNHYDTKILESSWSNMFGILLTNSFSIIGTIMGVKYATDNSKKTENK